MFNKQMADSIQTEDQKQQNRLEQDTEHDRAESVNINVTTTQFAGDDG